MESIIQTKGGKGLGFKELNINRALLAKLTWQIESDNDIYWVRSFKLITEKACFNVRPEDSIRAFLDPWVVFCDKFLPKIKDQVIMELGSYAKELFHENRRN